MKKILSLGLILSMAIGVTACTNVQNQQESEQQYIYGKVKSIVGNEIEFELAKTPEIDLGIMNGAEEDTIGKDKVNDKAPAAMTESAVSVDGNTKVDVGNIDKNEPLIELEFTEEEKTMTIPSGVNISVLSASTNKGLSAIKKGTYLRIGVDDNKSENPSILSVDVIS